MNNPNKNYAMYRAALVENDPNILNRLVERAQRAEQQRDNLLADKKRLDWLENKALGVSVNATLDDLVGKGWTSLRAAIDNVRDD